MNACAMTYHDLAMATMAAGGVFLIFAIILAVVTATWALTGGMARRNDKS
jgi:hypothetical protein